MTKENWLFRGVIIAIISAMAAFLAQHYGDFIMNNIGNFIRSFFMTFWPVMFGFLAFFIYQIITDYVRLRLFNNDLKKWIGYFSYPDKEGRYYYIDLKGKIKRCIQEELEKEQADRVEAINQLSKTTSDLRQDVYKVARKGAGMDQEILKKFQEK